VPATRVLLLTLHCCGLDTVTLIPHLLTRLGCLQKRQGGAPYNPVTVQFVHFPIVDMGLPSKSELPKLISGTTWNMP
jgi:hypothetical protein